MNVYFCSECGNLYDITDTPPETTEQLMQSDEKKKLHTTKKVYFTCTHCGHYELMPPQTLLVSKTSREIAKSYYANHTKASDMMAVKVLKHTRDYVCPNKECQTHKHPEIRNATICRVGNSFKVQYMCTLCQTRWT